ncbi:MAG: hypothetical protein ABW195_18790 [Ilumatobacteraceae bacterium]
MDRHVSTALTDRGLAALRRAAVMAHTVGAISLRLTAGSERIVDVVPDPDRAARVPAMARPRPKLIDPCGFRMAVARAWVDHRAGREIGLIGLEHADDLDISWTVVPPGQHLGFGAVRAPCAGRMIWAFASILPPDALTAVMSTLDEQCDGVARLAPDGLTARLVHDELLDATVVHVEADPPGSSATRVLDEVLRRMVAAVAATEVVDQLFV